MDHPESDFDYQSVLETYGLQGENVKKATEENSQSDSQYHNDYNNFKKLKKEWKHKYDNLFDTLLKQRKHLQKLNSITSKQTILNKQTANLQEKTSAANRELQKQSSPSIIMAQEALQPKTIYSATHAANNMKDDFTKKIAAMDDDLQKLYSQFEGKTLSTFIVEVSNDLCSSENIKKHLLREYEKLKDYQVDIDAYERFPVVRMFTNEFGEHQKLEDIEKKIIEKKKNIQFLTTEIDKMSQMDKR